MSHFQESAQLLRVSTLARTLGARRPATFAELLALLREAPTIVFSAEENMLKYQYEDVHVAEQTEHGIQIAAWLNLHQVSASLNHHNEQYRELELLLSNINRERERQTITDFLQQHDTISIAPPDIDDFEEGTNHEVGQYEPQVFYPRLVEKAGEIIQRPATCLSLAVGAYHFGIGHSAPRLVPTRDVVICGWLEIYEEVWSAPQLPITLH